ncbi:MAG: hypothetical protein M0Q94_08170 [Candidatus Cloacimonetes bacterium]|jgi:protein-tyrosine phosphatase|nr:hypothetical protein [Candidatus Cloacimonadota bacterium]
MIDIHNHILPGIDDGSSDVETTYSYLDLIAEAKMKAVVFTPHYMRGFYDNTKDVVLKSFRYVEDYVKEKGYNYNIYCSAEVYLMGEEAVKDIQTNAFMINGTRYVLVENSLTGFSDDLFENLYKMTKLGLKPILAHPERYIEIQRNPSMAEDFMHRDVYLQINTGSILGSYGEKVKNVAFELIDRGFAHFLGSDCHCHSGVYDYPQAVEALRQEFDEDTAEVLSEDHPERMLNNENIPYFYVFHQPKPPKKNFIQKLFGL